MSEVPLYSPAPPPLLSMHWYFSLKMRTPPPPTHHLCYCAHLSCLIVQIPFSYRACSRHPECSNLSVKLHYMRGVHMRLRLRNRQVSGYGGIASSLKVLNGR